MDVFNILLVVIIILVTVYISVVFGISIFADDTSYNGGSGACEVDRQDMTKQPVRIADGAHIVIDGMNMLYHIKQHRDGDGGGYLDDVYFYSMIYEISEILTKSFPRNTIHLVFKNFPNHTLHVHGDFNINLTDISRRFANIVYHIAFDHRVYPRDKKLHYLHGRDDLLSIVVFNFNVQQAERKRGPMPFLISLDTYRDEFKFSEVPPFIERHYYRGKVTAEHRVDPAVISPEFVSSVVDHPNFIQFEIIDKSMQEAYPVDGKLYPQRNGNYYCANIFDISGEANNLEW